MVTSKTYEYFNREACNSNRWQKTKRDNADWHQWKCTEHYFLSLAVSTRYLIGTSKDGKFHEIFSA